MRTCSSGKRCFDSEVIAREALISVRAIHGYMQGEGPQGIYKCSECGCYHFTSKLNGETGLTREDHDRTIQQREAKYWEDKLKNR